MTLAHCNCELHCCSFIHAFTDAFTASQVCRYAKCTTNAMEGPSVLMLDYDVSTITWSSVLAISEEAIHRD